MPGQSSTMFVCWFIHVSHLNLLSSHTLPLTPLCTLSPIHQTPAKLAEDGIIVYALLQTAQGNLPSFVTFRLFSLLIIFVFLTLPTPCLSESCIKIKININFYFHTSLWCLKRFYAGLWGLNKTFWGSTKKVSKWKFKLIFSLCLGLVR